MSSPDDSSEREAERTADRVMRAPGSAPQGPKCQEGHGDPGHSQTRADAANNSEGAGAAPAVREALSSHGQPLDSATRSFMEPSFGHDLGKVRVHLGDAAGDSAARLGARAYTAGSDIVFGEGEYDPSTTEGQRLLAHELAHVSQQRGRSDTVIRRQVCPPRRAPDEVTQSAATGFIDPDVVFTPSQNRLEVFDFAIESDVLPAGVTEHPDWQRAVSYMGGDPTIRLAVTGFTDCVGSRGENLDLRRRRVASVIAAMPPAVQSRVLYSFTITTTTYVDPTNATPEARARNRSVRVTFQSQPPATTDPCDMIPQARTLDEYLFLVRCMESRLGLTSPTDTPRALSVLRQIYYGSSEWTSAARGGRDPLWASVIPTRPWEAGSDPRPALGPLYESLRLSDTVEGTDIGHLLAGIDAMMAPGPVEVSVGRVGVVTALQREEWATWAGDVGAAAARWTAAVVYGTPQTAETLDTSFRGDASDDDLMGDIDSFAMRLGLAGSTSPSSLLARQIQLTGPLSEALLQYFRITSSGPGRARRRNVEVFVESYGGTMSGGRIQDPAALAARLRPAIAYFAYGYMIQQLGSRHYFNATPPPDAPRPTGPRPEAIFDFAVTEMTNRFIDWLNRPHP